MKRWRNAFVGLVAIGLFLAGAGVARWVRWGTGVPGASHQEQSRGTGQRPAPSGGETVQDTRITLPLSVGEKVGLKQESTQTRSIEEVVAVNGIIGSHPDRTVALSTRIEGKTISARGLPGDRVEAGQSLIEIRSAELQTLQTDLMQASNRLGLAAGDRDLARELAARKAIALKELLRKEMEQRQAAREVEGLESRLRLLGIGEDEIERIKSGSPGPASVILKAPISGVIVERNAALGEAVKPEQVLFRIADLSRVLAEGEAFDAQAPHLRRGLPVRLTVPVFPGRLFEGRITSIGAAVDPEKRTLRFLVEVQNPEDAPLRPNMFAQMTVVIAQRPQVLAIPLAAVLAEGGEDVVFVAATDGYERRAVSLGVRDDRYVQVKDGLQHGERVVTTGKRQLEALYRRAIVEGLGGSSPGEKGTDID